MDLLQSLLMFYSGVIVINIALMTLLWKFYQQSLYLYGAGFWVCTFINFALQGVFEQELLLSVLSFATYYFCALILVRVLQLTTNIEVPYKKYHLIMLGALLLCVLLYTSGFDFTVVALPVALAVALPMLLPALRFLFTSKQSRMAKVYATILLLNGIHFLDYPFLRPIQEMALFGFSLAFIFAVFLSIYLPIFISKTLSDRYAKKLSDEIERRRKVEQWLIEARKQAEVASKAKSEFLSNMSHELRTPLHGMLGLTELMLSSDLDDELRSNAETVYGCGEELLSMIERILAFSALESGEHALVERHFSLAECVDSAIKNVSLKASKKEINIVRAMGEGVPSHIQGDPLKLTELLTGLLDNAVKFSDHGEVVVKVSAKQGDDKKTELIFAVQDKGIGIDSEKLDAIFESFIQVDGSSTRVHGGAGIGLSICKKLVDLLDGKIWVESEQGKGSTFYFSLPA